MKRFVELFQALDTTTSTNAKVEALVNYFQSVPAADAAWATYSGLTDSEINRVDNWVRRNTVERFGPVRSVKPELVFEIAFENIAFSKRHKSGVAVRFPRIKRWREDKPYSEADTLDNLKSLIRGNADSPSA